MDYHYFCFVKSSRPRTVTSMSLMVIGKIPYYVVDHGPMGSAADDVLDEAGWNIVRSFPGSREKEAMWISACLTCFSIHLKYRKNSSVV